MTRERLEKLQEQLINEFAAAVGDPTAELVAGFRDGVEHMTKALIDEGAIKLTT